MSGLTMPKKGEAARLLADLNAEHAPPPEAHEETPVNTPPEVTREESSERYNVTTLQERFQPSNNSANNETNVSYSNDSNVSAQKETLKDASVSSRKRTKETLEREERLQKAMQIASGDELDVATIRVSAKLHAYLERYVERINRINPKAKYRKQDAIEAAFAAFYADHPMPPAPVEEEL